jgi:hypothetical protein
LIKIEKLFQNQNACRNWKNNLVTHLPEEASNVLSNAVASLYPAYMSYKAIRSKSLKEIVPWLIYWIVMALFTLTESIADIFIFWVPFYFEFKIAFITWLILPQTQGYILVYKYFVHPLLKKHERAIDDTLKDVHMKAMQTSKDLGIRGINLLQRYATESAAASENSTFVRSRSASAPLQNEAHLVSTEILDKPMSMDFADDKPLPATNTDEKLDRKQKQKDVPKSKSPAKWLFGNKNVTKKENTGSDLDELLNDMKEQDYL